MALWGKVTTFHPTCRQESADCRTLSQVAARCGRSRLLACVCGFEARVIIFSFSPQPTGYRVKMMNPNANKISVTTSSTASPHQDAFGQDK